MKSKSFYKAQCKINFPKQGIRKHISKQKKKASSSSVMLEKQPFKKKRLESCKYGAHVKAAWVSLR